MKSGKRKRALRFFPLVLGFLLSGLPLWPVFQDDRASFAVLPESPHIMWEKEDALSGWYFPGDAGTTLIYSFQPWGGVSLEASDGLIFQTGFQPVSVQLLQVAPGKTEGKKDITREAFTPSHHRSLPPVTQIFRLHNANWMVTS